MGIRSWLQARRRDRLHRALKALHARQRDVRKRLEDLEDEHRRGTIADERYRVDRAALDGRRHELAAEIARVSEEEARLKSEA